MMKNRIFLLTIPFLLLGLLLLAGGLLPFPRLAPVVNHLAADGTLESFTPALHRKLLPLLLTFGGLFTLLGAAPYVLPGFSHRLLARGAAAWRNLGSDSRSFFQALRRALPTGWQAAALAVIILAGVFARLVYLSRPMGHDESYTVMAFANTPLLNVLSDYHLPNNHIFHSLLVHASISLFGMAPWAVRLPALLAGLLTIPTGYLFTRRVYGQSAALPAAAALALFPALFDYATNARGYTLIALFTMLGLNLALYLKNHDNRLAWGLLVLVMALGFWTIPLMLYPAGLIWLWLLGSSLLKDGSLRPGRMLRQLILAGLALVLLTGALYLPVVLRSGPGYVFNNPFIAPLTWAEFRETFPVRMGEIWAGWSAGLPGWLVGLIVVGVGLSILLHWKIASHRLPIQLTAAAWLAAEMLIARPNPYTRYFIFMLPLFLVWAAAGWVSPLQHLPPLRWRWPLSRLVSSALTLFLIIGGLARLQPDLGNMRPQPGEVEQMALYIVQHVQPGDVVIATSPNDTSLWYYMALHHLPVSAYFHSAENQPIRRAFVMVTLSDNQTLTSVLEEAHAPASLDPTQAEWLPFPDNNRLALIPAYP